MEPIALPSILRQNQNLKRILNDPQASVFFSDCFDRIAEQEARIEKFVLEYGNAPKP